MARRARNPETGELLEWDGTQWVPVRMEDPMSGMAGMSASIASGLTGGFNDEITGALSAIPALIPGGESYSDAYVRNRDAVRAAQQQWQESHPVSGFAAEVGGGMLGGGALGTAAQGIGALSRIPGWIRALAGGAAGGAAAGAGHAESIEDIPAEMLSGGAYGAAMGPLGPAAGRVLTGAGRALQRLWQGLSETPDATAQRLMRELLAETGMSPAEFSRRMDELGPDAIAADLSAATQRKLRALAAEDLGTDVRAREILDERQRGAGERLVDDAQAALGVPGDRFHTALREIDESRRAYAREQYGPIYDTVFPVDDQLEELMQRPSIRKGYELALRRSRDAGEPMAMHLSKDGTIKSAPTLAELDKVKQGLDAYIGDNTDPITGRINSDARSALAAKRALLGYIEESNPEIGAQYARARSTYAGYSAMEDAMRRGRNIFNEDAEATAERLAEMGDAEREAFKLGVFNAVRDEVESAKDTGNVGARMKFRSEKYRRRLREVFDSDEDLNRFLNAVERESTFGETRSLIEGGSPTARIQSDLDLLRADTGSALGGKDSTIVGLAADALQRAWRAGEPTQGPRFQVNQRMSDMLLGNQMPPRAMPPAQPGAPWFSPTGAAVGGAIAGQQFMTPESLAETLYELESGGL